MGLKLRFSLHFEVPSDAVFEAYSRFYFERGVKLLDTGDEFYRLDLHEREGDWVTLEAQTLTSGFLNCTNLLMFVYDVDYWGYQLCSMGKVVDAFVQEELEREQWFPNDPAIGNPDVLSKNFPWFTASEVAPYLQKLPLCTELEDHIAEMKRLNVRVRPEDQFFRFDECAILNFLRLLKVKAELHGDKVMFTAPVWKSFWIEGRQWH